MLLTLCAWVSSHRLTNKQTAYRQSLSSEHAVNVRTGAIQNFVWLGSNGAVFGAAYEYETVWLCDLLTWVGRMCRKSWTTTARCVRMRTAKPRNWRRSTRNCGWIHRGRTSSLTAIHWNCSQLVYLLIRSITFLASSALSLATISTLTPVSSDIGL